MSTPYAVVCKMCGNIEAFAYHAVTKDNPKSGQKMDPPVPLTPRGHVPVICRQCGSQDFRAPATAEDFEKFEARQHREARAIELTKNLDIDGLLKVPEDIRASAEIKKALSNLLAPLQGETLKLAQSLVMKVAHSGVAAGSEVWIEMYDSAVAKAIKDTKGVKAAA